MNLPTSESEMSDDDRLNTKIWPRSGTGDPHRRLGFSEFEQIEKTIGFQLSDDQRVKLNDLFNMYQGFYRLEEGALTKTQARKMLEPVKRRAHQLRESLKTVHDDTTLFILFTQEMRLEHENDSIRELHMGCVYDLEAAAQRTLDELNRKYSDRGGRPPNETQAWYVSQLLEFWMKMGKKVTTGWDAYSERRTSPFIRFVEAVSLGLPETTPSPSADFIHRVVKDWTDRDKT